MSVRQLYKRIYKEFFIINRKSCEAQSKKELERQRAKLQYEKFQLIRAKKSTKHLDELLENLGEGVKKMPKVKSQELKGLVKEGQQDPVSLRNLHNIGTFLRSQRVYSELVERYNPGLTMEQNENVRRTANRVGLGVPDN